MKTNTTNNVLKHGTSATRFSTAKPVRVPQLKERQDLEKLQDELEARGSQKVNDTLDDESDEDESYKKWECQGPDARTFQGGYSLWSIKNNLVNNETGETVCPANENIFAYEKKEGGVRMFGLVRGYWMGTEMIIVGRSQTQAPVCTDKRPDEVTLLIGDDQIAADSKSASTLACTNLRKPTLLKRRLMR